MHKPLSPPAAHPDPLPFDSTTLISVSFALPGAVYSPGRANALFSPLFPVVRSSRRPFLALPTPHRYICAYPPPPRFFPSAVSFVLCESHPPGAAGAPGCSTGRGPHALRAAAAVARPERRRDSTVPPGVHDSEKKKRERTLCTLEPKKRSRVCVCVLCRAAGAAAPPPPVQPRVACRPSPTSLPPPSHRRRSHVSPPYALFHTPILP